MELTQTPFDFTVRPSDWSIYEEKKVALKKDYLLVCREAKGDQSLKNAARDAWRQKLYEAYCWLRNQAID